MRCTGWLLAITMCCALAGCGASAGALTPARPRPACELDEHFGPVGCAKVAGRERLEAGKAALAKFDVDKATVELDAAAAAGPLDWESNVTLWEQRGIAAAYAEDEAAALRAFDTLLVLDPGHFLSYTLSPRATFVFEKARTAAQHAARPAVQLQWRRDARIGDPLPVDVEVIGDPKGALRAATLAVRTRGAPQWRALDLALRPVGQFQRVVLPPTDGKAPATLELYLRVFDADGNEVLRWASPEAPRELALRYEPPQPWHRKWWVRAIGGGVLLATTGAIVYFATREPPGTVDGTVDVR